jgi:hypothetical protein
MRLLTLVFVAALGAVSVDAHAEGKAPDDGRWRDFKSGKRIAAGLVYVGIAFPTEACTKQFGTSGKVARRDRAAFGKCLTDYLGRSDAPWKLGHGSSDLLYLESSLENARLTTSDLFKGKAPFTVYSIVVHRIADAKEFLRDNLPAMTPPASVLDAMKRDGVKKIAISVDFCVDHDGKIGRYGRMRASGYPEWDDLVHDQVRRWSKPFLVDGVGVRICDEIEIVYPAPGRAAR